LPVGRRNGEIKHGKNNGAGEKHQSQEGGESVRNNGHENERGMINIAAVGSGLSQRGERNVKFVLWHFFLMGCQSLSSRLA
jgi:hypothetical protein